MASLPKSTVILLFTFNMYLCWDQFFTFSIYFMPMVMLYEVGASTGLLRLSFLPVWAASSFFFNSFFLCWYVATFSLYIKQKLENHRVSIGKSQIHQFAFIKLWCNCIIKSIDLENVKSTVSVP